MRFVFGKSPIHISVDFFFFSCVVGGCSIFKVFDADDWSFHFFIELGCWCELWVLISDGVNFWYWLLLLFLCHKHSFLRIRTFTIRVDYLKWQLGDATYNVVSDITIIGTFFDDVDGITSRHVTADSSSCSSEEYGDCECGSSSYCSCTIGVCSQCEPGRYSDTAGGTSNKSCISCVAGTYNNISGATHCSTCPSGMYSTDKATDNDGSGVASGATTCASCPGGKYQESSSGYFCTSCSVGMTSTSQWRW